MKPSLDPSPWVCSPLVLYPRPREILSLGSDAPLPAGPLRCTPAELPAVRRFLAAAGLALDAQADATVAPHELQLGACAVRPKAEPPALGFALRRDLDGLVLRAAGPEGFLSGLQALWPVLERGRLPTCEIVDWPAARVRSFQIDLARQPETAAEVRRLIRQQARYRFNECQLYLENCLKLPCLSDAADPHGLSLEEFAALQVFGQALGIDVVPSLNLLGHMEKILCHPRFAHLSETAHGARNPRQAGMGCICPELPEARELIRAMIRETAAASRSPKLMVGLDECWSIGSHPLTRRRLDAQHGAGEIFHDWILFLHEEIVKAGKRMWMWEDMLFYHTGALGRIPADIGMNEWHYQHVEEYPMYSFQNWRRIDALGELRRQGHPVMLCCGPEPHHLLSMMRYAEGRDVDGFLVVQWEGAGEVQERYHVGRALAGGILWSGELPAWADAARSLSSCSERAAPRVGRGLAAACFRPAGRGGGADHCPRFWSWPETLPALLMAESALAGLAEGGTACPALQVQRCFLEAERNRLAADWARETAALAGRSLLQSRNRQSPSLDQALRRLAETCASARRLAAAAVEMQARYAPGLPERPMAAGFTQAAAGWQELLQRLERFRDEPCEATWPFCRVSLHVDGLVLDPCSHSLRLSAGDAAGRWQDIYSGPVRLPPSLEGEWVMSFPLEAVPARVRIEVGGFASLGLTRIRVETLAGTQLASRVVESGGHVRDAQHLLAFDRRLAVFNPAEVLTEWRSLEPPQENFVILAFD
ncbi:MAG: family 20 glycosylhydrolase [Planctomycetota bacterium]